MPVLPYIRNRVDFHPSVLERQRGDDDGGAGGLGFTEELRVNLVHGFEVVRVDQEYATPHDRRHGGTATFQDVLDVGQHLPRFHLHVAGDHLTGYRIDRDLSSYEDEIAGTHGGGIRAARGGGAGG